MVALTKYTFSEDIEPSNHRKSDRVFVLEKIDPNEKNWRIDTRLIDGKNRLHAVKDFQLPLWNLKLDNGQLPEQLNSSFTSFTAAKKTVEAYFNKRGVKVTEVLD